MVKHSKKKNRKKSIIVSIICYLFIFLFLIMLIISGIHIFSYIKDSNSVSKQMEEIKTKTKIYDHDENSEIIDFDKLNKINKDTIGWITVKDTNIDYPFVRADNNNYYLTHSFDKTYNIAGWIWLDYRNNYEDFDKHTIIYGHGMANRTMFGSLRWVLDDKWLNDPSNYTINIYTKKNNLEYKVFSVYHIKTTDDYLKVKFNSDKEFIDFSNMLINRSVFNFNNNVNKDDKILTLSTCYSQTEKVVLHAKLVKTTPR